jgi:hypothetical protein
VCIIANIDIAFGDLKKPEHFGDYQHCDECAEHDRLLCERDRTTLTIEDVGNECWDPIAFSSPAGIGYYMPTLARLALSTPPNSCGCVWYGDQLLFHLDNGDLNNRFLRFCNTQQRKAIADLLTHMLEAGVDVQGRLSDLDEIARAVAIWSLS